MNQSINLDDPRFTDYALGELNGAERADFEAILEDSPVAGKELKATQDLISLLTEGLENEWQNELSPGIETREPVFEVIDGGLDDNSSLALGQEGQEDQEDQKKDQKEEEKVHDFTRPSKASRRPVLMSLAAVLAGLLVVGAVTLSQREAGQNFASSADENCVWVAPADDSGELVLASADRTAKSNAGVSVVLIDEIAEPIDGFELAFWERKNLNSSYFGSGSKVNTVFGADTSNQDSRADSYLPQSPRVFSPDQSEAESSDFARGLVMIGEVGDLDFETSSLFDAALPDASGESVFNIADEFGKVQSELEEIILHLNDSTILTKEEFGILKRRLNQLLEQHKELASQIGSGS